MIRLRQLTGSDAGRVMDVDASVVRVGRMQDSEFALHPYEDLEVSARHAVLEHDGVEWSITDVGSKNGTWINGRRIVRWVVADGDEISLGASGPRIRIELPATLHVRVGERSGEQPTLPSAVIEAQVVPARSERPPVRATPKSGAPVRSRTSVPPAVPPTPGDASEARPKLPPPTIRPPRALPPSTDVPELEAEPLDQEDEDERTRPRTIPPTIKTPLEKPDPVADSMPRGTRPRASTFAIVVISLSVGFALGFGFALAFGSPS